LDRSVEEGTFYKKVIDKIKLNKQRRLEGKYNCIPWSNLPKLCKIIPGIEQEQYVIVTASSKVGKTQLGDFLYVLEPYKFIKENPNCGLSLKIFYFSLEISKEKKMLSLLSNKIFKETGKIISSQNLNSKFKDYILDDETETLLDKYHSYFSEFEKTVEIIDNIRNPYGIFLYMKQYAEANGKYVTKEIDWYDDISKKTIKKKVNDYYEPDNPDELVIVFTDHISLLLPEKGQILHQAMSKYSSDYCLHMRDKFKYCVVNVQQQSAEQEKQQFTNQGESVLAKLRPSADGLGDNKLTGRDCNLMFGLFAPHRYNIKNHNTYSIERLKDNYRELSVLFNRDGQGFCTDDLLFNGAVNYFEEAPELKTEEDYKKVIERIRK
jgi:hypothetical protein